MPQIVSLADLGPGVTDGPNPVEAISRGLQLGIQKQQAEADDEIRRASLDLQRQRYADMARQQRAEHQAQASQRQSRASQEAMERQAVGQMVGQAGGDPELAQRLSGNALSHYLRALGEQQDMREAQQAAGQAMQLLESFQEGVASSGMEIGEEEAAIAEEIAQAIQSVQTSSEAKQVLDAVHGLRQGFAARMDREEQYPKAIQQSQGMLEAVHQMTGGAPEVAPYLEAARMALHLAGIQRGAPPGDVQRMVFKALQTGELPEGLAAISKAASSPEPVSGIRAELQTVDLAAMGREERAEYLKNLAENWGLTSEQVRQVIAR